MWGGREECSAAIHMQNQMHFLFCFHFISIGVHDDLQSIVHEFDFKW